MTGNSKIKRLKLMQQCIMVTTVLYCMAHPAMVGTTLRHARQLKYARDGWWLEQGIRDARQNTCPVGCTQRASTEAERQNQRES